MQKYRSNIIHFFEKETVLCISGVAAIITMFIIPPSSEYIAYLDFRVIALLFCLMTVIAGLTELGIFVTLSEKLLKKVVGLRTLSLALVMLCFFTSMLITNDVALITFVPFSIIVLSTAGQSKYIIRIVVLQTIAANLGSMLTPLGNPQNLYLYSYYNISMIEFLKITFPYVAVAFVLLCITALFIKKEPLRFEIPEEVPVGKNKTNLIILYSILFLVCLACVLRFLDYRITLIVIAIVILIFDRKVIRKVDYSLLFTFVFFFIFVGNLGNMTVVNEVLGALLKNKELPVAIVTSQVISNVPAAVLLSGFTADYKALILGANIGGLGTLVASLASLISYKLYCKTEDANPRKFLGVFTGYNLLFLAGLCLFYKFGKYVMLVLLFLLLV